MNCYNTLILPVCQYLDFSTIWWMIWIGIGINASQIMYLLCWADWSLAGPVINKSYIFCDISIFQMMSWIWPDRLTSDLAEGDGMSLDKYLIGISDISNILETSEIWYLISTETEGTMSVNKYLIGIWLLLYRTGF